MRIPPIRTRTVNNLKFKNVRQKIPRKVTLDSLPIVAGTVGLFTPIPFASIALFGLGKAIQIVAKKFLHKP